MPEAAKCVYCRAEPAADLYRPFCSDRCKMADLGRWLKGDYAVPAIAQRGVGDVGIADAAIENFEIEDEP